MTPQTASSSVLAASITAALNLRAGRPLPVQAGQSVVRAARRHRDGLHDLPGGQLLRGDALADGRHDDHH